MDLQNYDTRSLAEEGAVLHVRGPLGDHLYDEETGEPVTITVKGSDSKTYESTRRELERRKRTMQVRRQGLEVDHETAEANLTEVMAACTVAWAHIVSGGEVVPCNRTNAHHLYTEYPWLREQVLEFIQDRSNFLGEGSRNS